MYNGKCDSKLAAHHTYLECLRAASATAINFDRKRKSVTQQQFHIIYSRHRIPTFITLSEHISVFCRPKSTILDAKIRIIIHGIMEQHTKINKSYECEQSACIKNVRKINCECRGIRENA